MLTPLQSETRRQQLVRALQANEAIQTPQVADAFLKVPRELFIEAFYERDSRDWKRRTKMEAADRWLDAIYQDDALTTAINQYHLPISSSSQPGVMAQMLEALSIRPGQRVLEIGTGTGYNAALLAELVRNPSLVTTIEVDAKIADRAATLLHQHVGQVQVQVGDGRLGGLVSWPYDRIIATASSSFLPRVWFSQLASGGRLVMPLEGDLQRSGFLVIEKEGDSGRGVFRPISLHFMALHSEDEEIRPYPAMPSDFPRQLPVTATLRMEGQDPFLAALQDRAFQWYLQWAWPKAGKLRVNFMGSPDGKRALRIYDTNYHSIMHLTETPDGSWSGSLRGSFPLWVTIQQVYRQYQHLGQPGQEAFQVVIERSQASLIVSSQNLTYCLRDVFDP